MSIHTKQFVCNSTVHMDHMMCNQPAFRQQRILRHATSKRGALGLKHFLELLREQGVLVARHTVQGNAQHRGLVVKEHLALEHLWQRHQQNATLDHAQALHED